MSADVANPYRGAQSFLGQHGSLFYGREREARLLTDLILREAVAILSAGSGVGKTSLLHARVIPMLEMADAAVVYAHPVADAAAALALQAINQLFPATEDELTAVERLEREAAWIAALPLEDIPYAVSSLQENALRISLIEPVNPAQREAKIPNLPMVCRWLRGSITLERLMAHFALMTGRDAAGGPHYEPLDSFAALRLRIASAMGREALITELTRLPAVDPLQHTEQPTIGGSFPSSPATVIVRASNLLQSVAPAGLVIIIDQFEEIYNRVLDASYGGPNPGAADSNWVEREALFAQLGCMLREGGMSKIRLLLSLRHERLADLASELSSTGLIDRRTYILGALDLNMAREAITMPAASAKRRIEPDAVEQMITGLRDIKPEVDTFILQLACWRLWQKSLDAPTITTWQVRNAFEVGAEVHAGEIAERTARLHLEDVLKRNPSDSLEMLELMSLLVTDKGTRDVVPWDRLLHAWRLRNVATLDRSLATLMDKETRVIRQIGLDRSIAYEIAHERLIRPGLDLLKEHRERAGPLGRLTAALHELHDHAAWLLRSDAEGQLTPQDRDVLRAGLKRTKLDPPAAAILLDSVLRGKARSEQDRQSLRADAAQIAVSLYRDLSQSEEWPDEGIDLWVERLARRRSVIPAVRVAAIALRYRGKSISSEIRELLLRSALRADRAAIDSTLAAFFEIGADE